MLTEVVEGRTLGCCSSGGADEVAIFEMKWKVEKWGSSQGEPRGREMVGNSMVREPNANDASNQ